MAADAGCEWQRWLLAFSASSWTGPATETLGSRCHVFRHPPSQRKGRAQTQAPVRSSAARTRRWAQALVGCDVASMSSPAGAGAGAGYRDSDAELVRLTLLHSAAESRDRDGDAASAAACTSALQPAALRALVAQAQTAPDPVRHAYNCTHL